jgi:hypothetical protein
MDVFPISRNQMSRSARLTGHSRPEYPLDSQPMGLSAKGDMSCPFVSDPDSRRTAVLQTITDRRVSQV